MVSGLLHLWRSPVKVGIEVIAGVFVRIVSTGLRLLYISPVASFFLVMTCHLYAYIEVYFCNVCLNFNLDLCCCRPCFQCCRNTSMYPGIRFNRSISLCPACRVIWRTSGVDTFRQFHIHIVPAFDLSTEYCEVKDIALGAGASYLHIRRGVLRVGEELKLRCGNHRRLRPQSLSQANLSCSDGGIWTLTNGRVLTRPVACHGMLCVCVLKCFQQTVCHKKNITCMVVKQPS